MKRFLIPLILVFPILCSGQTKNYLEYHIKIIQAEEYIVARQFNESIKIYRSLLDNYGHVFLRDIKVAVQLSAYIGDTSNLFYFLERGMEKGWTLKEAKKSNIITGFKNDSRWHVLKTNQDQYKTEFEQNINLELRAEIKKMLAGDQKRAIRVALTPVKKWREHYTEKKFVPNNRIQIRRINQIIDQIGFPGEKIIGDKSWATVIISHNEHDTIYNEIRPKLFSSLERGELSAIELAIIETWRIAVDSDRKEKGFVIWNEEISKTEAIKADSLRQSIGLRSIELNNKLIQTENELEMNFYLAPFHGGKITIKE